MIAKVLGVQNSGPAKPAAKTATATLSSKQVVAHAPTQEREPETVDEAIARAMRIHGIA
jgi:hypothetical protein